MTGRRAFTPAAAIAAVAVARLACGATVAVSIAPQCEVVERIGGDSVRVELLVEPGQSPHTYEPTPRQLVRLAEADLWILAGVPFERSLASKLASVAPALRPVNGLAGIALQPMASRGSGGHGHEGLPDPHFWLDPELVAAHAATVRDALCALDPAACAGFDANLAAYRAELRAADARVTARLAPLAGRELYVFHPAFGYFARRYRLLEVAVEVEGKEPTGRQLGLLIDRMRASGACALFVQPQFSGATARAVAEAAGVQLLELDPLARDLTANLERMADRIAAACGG